MRLAAGLAEKDLKTVISGFSEFACVCGQPETAPYHRVRPLERNLQKMIGAVGLPDRIHLLVESITNDMPSHYAGAAAFVLALIGLSRGA